MFNLVFETIKGKRADKRCITSAKQCHVQIQIIFL